MECEEVVPHSSNSLVRFAELDILLKKGLQGVDVGTISSNKSQVLDDTLSLQRFCWRFCV